MSNDKPTRGTTFLYISLWVLYLTDSDGHMELISNSNVFLGGINVLSHSCDHRLCGQKYRSGL